MAVKNFFSGVEGDHHWSAATRSGADHVLMSYLYLQKTGDALLHKRKKANPEIEIFVDSGAHTLQTNSTKPPYNTWKLPEYEKYLRDYVAWLRKNKAYIKYAAELDISYPLNISAGRKGDDAYGHQIVEGWRRKVFAPLQDEGIEVIYVWHGFNGLQGWEQMCEEYPYVGLPGELSSESDFNKYISVARRYCTKVHGFAATKQVDFSTWPWFSVDSTSWKSGERYGSIAEWNENKQRYKVYERCDRYILKDRYIKFGFNSDDIIEDRDYKEATRYTLFSMVRMEKFYRERFKNRVFYYDLRLPTPAMVSQWADKRILSKWKQFDPERVFNRHAKEADVNKLRSYLIGIASVQNGRTGYYGNNQSAIDFLTEYFPNQMAKQPLDLKEFKKELAAKTTPRNREPQERLLAIDFIPTNNVPKSRKHPEYTLAELEWDNPRFPFLKEMRGLPPETKT